MKIVISNSLLVSMGLGAFSWLMYKKVLPRAMSDCIASGAATTLKESLDKYNRRKEK